MSNLTKTKQWLVANTNQTDPDPEWFLAMWVTQNCHEFSWKDNGHTILDVAKHGMAGIEDDFFECLANCDEDQTIAKEFVKSFYDE